MQALRILVIIVQAVMWACKQNGKISRSPDQTNKQTNNKNLISMCRGLLTSSISKCFDTKKGWDTAPIFQPEGYTHNELQYILK